MRRHRDYYRDEIDPDWRPEYERDHRESDHRDQQEYRDPREHRDHRDPRDPRDHRDHRDHPDHRDHRDYRDHRDHREHRDRRMVKMTPLDDHERKIIIEFCHLLEKSKQLFNGLRELPPYGHKQWQSYFGRTFDVYTKLWKFQQQHRLILDTRYGLKRWQIGEIASKIGQLYYHFYLRTSETAYLREAFAFYHAIRGRSYYTKANREDKCELMVKKLRYYARFIVVAILLKKSKLIKELVRELDRQVIEYGATYDPEDQAEWNVVLEEVKAFLIAEPGVAVIHPDNPSVALTISGRVNNMTIPPIEKTPQMYLTLQDAVIIGSGSYQVKFSELTIDMFRILQNLERESETPEDSPHCRSSSTAKGPAPIPKGIQENGLRPENPHKYLLFKPSPSQVLIYLASSCNDLTINGAILIYISADGYHPNQNKHPEDYGYDIGGLITTSKSDIFKECNKERKDTVPKYKEQQILYPGDLQPFTRKPLFIIVDSDNSYAFQHIPRIFGQPLVILMSPLELPVGINDRRKKGGLFTLYLHNPIAGLCNTCDVFTLPIPIWDKCISLLDVFMKECVRLLLRVRMDPVYYPFLGDDYLRLLILRYIFCECTLRLHKGFRARSNLTRAAPPLPDELFEHRDLVSIALEMTGHIGIKNQFYDSSPSGPLPSRE